MRGLHLVVGVGAMDHDRDLGLPLHRADAAAMDFLSGQHHVELDRVNAVVASPCDVPVSLHVVGWAAAAGGCSITRLT